MGRNEQVHHRDRRGKDPGIWGKIRGVTLGRSLVQQGLTATCTDPLTKALTIGSGRTEGQCESAGLPTEPYSGDMVLDL